MSGYHWSDDPVEVTKDDNRRAWKEHLRKLGYDRHIPITDRQYITICPDCHAMVYMGDIEREVPVTGTHPGMHRAWHDEQDRR